MFLFSHSVGTGAVAVGVQVADRTATEGEGQNGRHQSSTDGANLRGGKRKRRGERQTRRLSNNRSFNLIVCCLKHNL